jgi:glycosyltransferase involved in cell wall biosynthesis
MAEAFWRRGHKVLYVESGDPRPFRRILRRSGGGGSSVVGHLQRRGFFVMRAWRCPWLPATFPDPARRWNCRRTSIRAARFLEAKNAGRVHLVHCHWAWPELFEDATHSVRRVYDCDEDHRAAPAVEHHPLRRRQLVRTETRLMAAADLTVFASGDLADARDADTRAAAVLPLGVDAEHFARPMQHDPHEKLGLAPRDPRRLRVGYVGHVTDRCDWALVRAAARAAPDWDWIIAGPLEGVRPRGPDNLHWIGPVRYESLPALMQHWDAGLLPYGPTHPYNRHAWPMKLLEYLATGLPVVATDIPAAQDLAKRLPRLVHVCDQPASERLVETARRAVDAARNGDDPRDAGRTLAARHTWDARARQVLELLKAQTNPRADRAGSAAGPAREP